MGWGLGLNTANIFLYVNRSGEHMVIASLKNQQRLECFCIVLGSLCAHGLHFTVFSLCSEAVEFMQGEGYIKQLQWTSVLVAYYSASGIHMVHC